MTKPMVIELDGAGWETPQDFLAGLREAIGAPDWHGWNPAAFVDSMIWGGINSVDPPYTILVTGLEGATSKVIDYVDLISVLLETGDDEHLVRRGRRINAKVVRHMLPAACAGTE